jgi:trimeric autotransporter adhesin
MLVASLSNRNLQESDASPSTPTIPKAATASPAAPQPQSNPTTASAPAVVDTYTPSQAASGTGVTIAPDTGASQLPPAVLTALGSNYVTPTQQAWLNLTQSMAAGDFSSAQTDLSALEQTLSSSTENMSALTAPSAQFLNDLTALGSALNSGNPADAQSAFQAAQQNYPDTVAGAMATALDAITNDMEQAAQLGGSANMGQLSSDLSTLDGVLEEANANISAQLVAAGFSTSEASEYASSVTTISIDVSSYESNGSDSSATSISVTTSVASALDYTSAASTPETGSTLANPTNGAPSQPAPLLKPSSSSQDSTLAVASSISNSISFTTVEQTQNSLLLESAQETSSETALDTFATDNAGATTGAASSALGLTSATLTNSESLSVSVSYSRLSVQSSEASLSNMIAQQHQKLLANTTEIRNFSEMIDSIETSSKANSLPGAAVDLRA